MIVPSHLQKDVRLLFRDRKGLLIALVLPAVILAAYSALDLGQIAESGRDPDALILSLSTCFPVLLIASGAMVAERRGGTFQRISRSPANMFALVVSKSIAGFSLVALQVVIIMVVGAWALQGRVLEAPFATTFILLGTGLASHSLGTLLSSSVSTETQASQLTALLLLLMITLSGFLQPLDQLGALGFVAGFAPLALGYAGAENTLAGVADLNAFAFLLLTSAVFLLLAGVISIRRA